MVLCIGDMGFILVKMYDFEVWFLGQGVYCEILLCFNCEDFQVCCVNLCFKLVDGGKLQFVYILNGLGLVMGCIVVVIFENYQQEDGIVCVFEVLQLYIGGVEVLILEIV